MAAGDAGPDYAITTVQGAIPYIIETGRAFLNKPRLVLLDDFLYKDSFYDRGGDQPLREFIASEADVYLGVRERPCLLKSKRGNFRVSRSRYDEVVARMKADVFADYDTGRVTRGGTELVEPADIDELARLISEGKRLFGTGFINRMTESGRVLSIEGGCLCCRDIGETDHEYVKYMFSIKEMNAFTFISENNYRVLFEFFAGFS